MVDDKENNALQNDLSDILLKSEFFQHLQNSWSVLPSTSCKRFCSKKNLRKNYMINVFCLKCDKKYDRSFVTKLKDSVNKHLTKKHKFFCLTDEPKEKWDILSQKVS